jgi:hypothetical protein
MFFAFSLMFCLAADRICVAHAVGRDSGTTTMSRRHQVGASE